MPKTVFSNGSRAFASWFNAIQNFSFVANPQNDGEYPLISNSMLSQTPGQLLPEWQAFRDALRVSAGTGLAITWTTGSVFLSNNTLASITAGSTTVSANATSFVFVNASGAVAIATSLPIQCVPLASVVAGASSITSVTDLRPRFRVLPRPNTIKLFGGGGDEGAFSLTSGSATLDQSEYYFSGFNLGSAATLTVDKVCHIRVSGDVTISGTISVLSAYPGGGFLAAISNGAQLGFFNGVGAGTPSGAIAGVTYSYLTQPCGSGGQSGFISAPAASGSGSCATYGGPGGGGLIIEVGGNITIASSGSILARGGNAPPATPGLAAAVSGGGGGSGGLILLKAAGSITCQPGSTLDVRGGNGATGSGTGDGGGGGGGGRVALVAPVIATSGANILLAGGAKGAPGSGTAFSGGFGGSFGGVGANSGSLTGGAGIYTARLFAPVG